MTWSETTDHKTFIVDPTSSVVYWQFILSTICVVLRRLCIHIISFSQQFHLQCSWLNCSIQILHYQ